MKDTTRVIQSKKRLLMPKDICAILDMLDNQVSYAPYETKLYKACQNWLQNYNRRKYS